MAADNEININIKAEESALRQQIAAGRQQLKQPNIVAALSDKQRKQLEVFEATMDELGKKAEWSAQETRKANSAFQSWVNLLIEGSTKIKEISPELKKALRQLETLRSNLDEAQKRRDIVAEKISTKKGVTRASDTYFEQRVRDADITFKNTSKAVSYAAIERGVTEKGVSAFASPADFKKAQELYKQLQPEAEAILKEWKATEQTIGQINNQIDTQLKLVEKLTIEQKASGGENLFLSQATAMKTQTEAAKDADLKQIIKDTNEANVTREASIQQLNDFTSAQNKQTTSLGKAFKQFSIYAIALRTVKTALREATQTIARLDQYLTEQAMVTGKTRKETYQLLESYQEMAGNLGTTTKEVAEVTTQFLRQGKSVQDSLKLTEAAISAAKVAGINATESVNYLTTALNGFQLSADQAIRVSDKFAAVAATAATSYDEIAIALSKVAAQANLAGMSIDYTTALLTKGLETTREAPETIGTALKTIIARMRELSDYGETLGGDTDINNVESQLAYVGIQLRDNNGELRSTEDVLNDLGQKWDTLNSNQQAAVAKALAGTRQQSRLIAMMSDYERVLELQQISERSAGATVAQMATYLEGMEAATNKVRVAWEGIITTITDSDLLINFINLVSEALNGVNAFLSSSFGQFVFISSLLTIGTLILGNKIKELALHKLQFKIEQAQQLITAKKQLTEQKVAAATANEAKAAAAVAVSNQEALIAKLKTENASKNTIAQEEGRLLSLREEYSLAEKEAQVQEDKVTYFATQLDELNAQETTLGKITSMASGWTVPLISVISAYKTISSLITAIRAKKAADHTKTMAEGASENAVIATGAAAKPIKQLGVWGIPIAIAVAAAFGLALAGLTALAGGLASIKTPTEQIDSMSNTVYNLQKSVLAINSVISSFEKLDDHIIKTKKDTEDMATALEGAADKLSSETSGALHDMLGLSAGQSAQDYYKMLNSDEQRAKFLKQYVELSNTLIRQQNEQIIRTIKQHKLDLSLTENATAAAAVYARNNRLLYDYVDTLNNVKDGVQDVTQAILENIKANQALNLTEQQIQNLTQQIQSSSGVSIFTDESATIKDRAAAFRELSQALQYDADALKAFNDAYSEWVSLANMGDDVLDIMDRLGLNIDKLNDLNAGYKKLQKNGVDISQESYQSRMQTMLGVLAATGGDVAATVRTVFASELDRASQDYEKWWNAFVSVLGDSLTVGILNMGQSIDTLQNNINAFYEKASKWTTLTETEKNEFLADYADLFSGENGAKLKAAFESGNYNLIHEALLDNEVLQDQVDKQLQQVEQELAVEKARIGSARNEAYIAELEEYKKQLQNRNKLFQADLKLRLEQQNKQLDEYKSYLQEQEKALTDSLNKRRDAYEKYFNAINESKEDEEYDEQAQLLASNLSKLGSTTNAAAVNQRAELEQQLRDLEKERLETLRERAQEAILNEMDDTLNAISEKFDKLLESNQALLMALTGQLNNPVAFLTSMLANRITGGATELEMQDYFGTLRSTYGSILSDIDWDSFSFGTDVSNNLTLNVAGEEVNLSTADSRVVFAAIETALKQIGYK